MCYPVFDVIPHTRAITAQAYELPHKALKYPELRLSAVITIERFQKKWKWAVTKNKLQTLFHARAVSHRFCAVVPSVCGMTWNTG